MSKLSRLINKLAPAAAIAAPILSGVNPVLGAGLGIVSRLGAPAAAAPPSPTFAAGPAVMVSNPALARLGAAVGGSLLGIARTAAGKIKGVWLSIAGGGQKFINRKKAVALAKRVGLDSAALALGISAVEMSEMILDDAAAPRRGKGITARNIRTTKRVIGQVQRIHCQLGLKRGGAPRRACA